MSFYARKMPVFGLKKWEIASAKLSIIENDNLEALFWGGWNHTSTSIILLLFNQYRQIVGIFLRFGSLKESSTSFQMNAIPLFEELCSNHI